MDIYILEYYEEIEHEEFSTDRYALIGVYFSEGEAELAKKSIITDMNINEEYLFVSATDVGKSQWEGGFARV